MDRIEVICVRRSEREDEEEGENRETAEEDRLVVAALEADAPSSLFRVFW